MGKKTLISIKVILKFCTFKQHKYKDEPKLGYESLTSRWNYCIKFRVKIKELRPRLKTKK